MNDERRAAIDLTIDVPFWYPRPRNTDYAYMLGLQGLTDYVNINPRYSDSLKLVLDEALLWVGRKFAPKQFVRVTRRVYKSEVQNCERIVYSHGRFPLYPKEVKVAWLYGVVDPIMQQSAGTTPESVQQQYAALREPLERGAVLFLQTKAMQRRHQQIFPGYSTQFKYLPFFLPKIEAISEQKVIEKHCQPSLVKVIFIGREGSRKGLDLVIGAIQQLDRETQQRLHFTVVTSKSSLKSVPTSHIKIDTIAEAPHQHVLKLMQNSHVLIMPSRYETYGIVFLEAMAAGCAVIAPHWESQTEILDNGNAGRLVAPSIEAVHGALSSIVDDTERARLALAGHRRFVEEFSASKVANAHYSAFEELLLQAG